MSTSAASRFHAPATPSIAPTTIPLDELRSAWRALQAGRYRASVTGVSRDADPLSRPETPPNPGAVPTVLAAPAVRARGSSAGTGSRTAGQDGVSTSSSGWLLPVIGCHGSAGTTTLALALAEAATTVGLTQRRPAARVIEWAGPAASGLVAASTSELGEVGEPYRGWRHGRRGNVHLYRAQIPADHVGALPSPPPAARAAGAADTTCVSGTTMGTETPGPCCLGGAIASDGCVLGSRALHVSVLDPGLTIGRIALTDPSMSTQIARAPSVVLVAGATIPGWRHLEHSLSCVRDLCGAHATAPDAIDPYTTGLHANEPRDRHSRTRDPLSAGTVLVAMLGRPQHRWPAALIASAGPLTRQLLDTQGAIFRIPLSQELALRGVDSTPLPAELSNAARRLLDRAAASVDLSAGADLARFQGPAEPHADPLSHPPVDPLVDPWPVR